jgi:hypothetical protein
VRYAGGAHRDRASLWHRRIDLSKITITTGKLNGEAQATTGMTPADFFAIKVECCTQSEKIVDAEDKNGGEVLHHV